MENRSKLEVGKLYVGVSGEHHMMVIAAKWSEQEDDYLYTLLYWDGDIARDCWVTPDHSWKLVNFQKIE